ncbi:MAG TPA: cobalamin-dependent protein [Streptosporangiaceae bacterium]|nr:cobalamin-dependent protein [Streptosporangiaceae bacterium]
MTGWRSRLVSLPAYAGILERSLGSQALGRHALGLLRGQVPSERDALLDSHSRLLRAHLDRIAAALAGLDQAAAVALSEAGPAPGPDQVEDAADRAALWLIQALEPRADRARALAVATARLGEDSDVLYPAARHLRPLGLGFEALFDERLERRFLLLPGHPGRLAVLRRHLQPLMEDPDRGFALVERDLGRPLTGDDLAWLEVERRCAMLRFVRHRKTENGHIRWFLRKDEQQRVVLGQFGVRGHWIAYEDGTKTELTADAPPPAAPARGGGPQADPPALELRACAEGLALLESGHQLTRVGHDAEGDPLLDFLDVVDCVADLSAPHADIEPRYEDSAAVQWTLALLRHRRQGSRRVRLVYVPSAIPHQLGGVPLIGLEFLRDRLERAGARVNVLLLPPAQFERRIIELLGAEVIGIGVYIHNVREVADLVGLLRARGYQGKIILGGPQLRDIDGVRNAISGWDALIRGEAEDALPAVLTLLDELDAGRWAEALRLARSLSGVAIRHREALLLCDTAERLRAEALVCPLPFDWMRGKPERRLQMNFTRGCPYKCVFCPNHQGQLYRAGPAGELWRFTELAVADNLDLPPDAELAFAQLLQRHLGVRAVPQLRAALHLLVRAGAGALSGRQVKEAWLDTKLELLRSGQLRPKPPFVLITSEDNTLVNKAVIREYLARRLEFGFEEHMIFDPGQNTVWDLTGSDGAPDEEYIADLVRGNPFAVALGVDGASNPVIRQNNKPRYTIGTALAVNRALARHGVVVTNNYILLTPETDLLEAVEAFALFALLPLPWRDYGHSVNLRVIKEEGTLAHDEGLIFAPDDAGWDEPLRFAEVAELLDRWSLTSRVASDELRPLLWKILGEDPEAAALLPLVVERWQRNYDGDDELLALGQRIAGEARPEVALVETLRAISRGLAAGAVRAA